MLPTPVHVRPAYASCRQFLYVATFHESSTELDRVTALKKRGSRHNLQHAGWPIHGSIPSFSLELTNEAVEKVKTSINSRLLGLPGSYHRHAIGTFNTCSRVPTPRSLTDTGRDYHIENFRIATALSPPFPSEGSTDPPNWPRPVSTFNQVLTTKPRFWVLKNLWPPRGLSTTRPSTVAYIYT
jgi:hypothetical protein